MELNSQYKFFVDKCKGYDVLRTIGKICRRITGTSETELASLTANILLNNTVYLNHNVLDKLLTVSSAETGYIAENIIAPLISAYISSSNTSYLIQAREIADFIIKTCKNPVLAFINIDKKICTNRNNDNYPFFEQISPILPVFASLTLHTKDTRYIKYAHKIVNEIEKSLAKSKFSYVFYGKSSSILPSPKLVKDLHRYYLISGDSKAQNMLRFYQNSVSSFTFKNTVVIHNMEYCSPVFNLLQPCLSKIDDEGFIPMMQAQSEFKGHVYKAQFKYDGDVLELLWKSEHYGILSTVLESGFKFTKFDGIATGIRNITKGNYESDHVMHPSYFSRWIVSSLLYESKMRYDQFVFSQNGHILLLKDR